jgi:predicted nuclease with TOPRIM domain
MKKVIGHAESLKTERNELRRHSKELSDAHERLNTHRGVEEGQVTDLQGKVNLLIEENQRLKEQVDKLNSKVMDHGVGSWSRLKLWGLGARAGQCRIRGLDCFSRPED